MQTTETNPAQSLASIIDEVVKCGQITDASLLERLKLVSAACAMPDPTLASVDAIVLASEMQAVIQNAWNRWDQLDQEDAPALGDKLQEYACMNLKSELKDPARSQAALSRGRDNIEQTVEGTHEGVVVSAWSEHDLDFLYEDDDLAHLSEAEITAHMPMIFERLSSGLKDILSERGNEHLACKWSLEKDLILAEIKATAAQA